MTTAEAIFKDLDDMENLLFPVMEGFSSKLISVTRSLIKMWKEAKKFSRKDIPSFLSSNQSGDLSLLVDGTLRLIEAIEEDRKMMETQVGVLWIQVFLADMIERELLYGVWKIFVYFDRSLEYELRAKLSLL